ncbi:hypothetical protein FXO38_04263 [Capsicum annuum]|nr:hypothetical protein FXO38_04263 [Capsicum annuum]
MVDILCPGKAVPWASTRPDILLKDFKAEARLWLNIIYSRVSPCTHITIVTNIRARMVACILSGISLTAGEISLFEWRYFKNHRDAKGDENIFQIALRTKRVLYCSPFICGSVFKPKYPLHSSILDIKDEVPVVWSADDAGGGDAELAGEDSS